MVAIDTKDAMWTPNRGAIYCMKNTLQLRSAPSEPAAELTEKWQATASSTSQLYFWKNLILRKLIQETFI